MLRYERAPEESVVTQTDPRKVSSAKSCLHGLRKTARSGEIDQTKAEETIAAPEPPGEENRLDGACADIETQNSFGHHSTFQDNSLTFRRSASRWTTPVIRSVIRP